MPSRKFPVTAREKTSPHIGAKLAIAKLDWLSRDAHFLLGRQCGPLQRAWTSAAFPRLVAAGCWRLPKLGTLSTGQASPQPEMRTEDRARRAQSPHPAEADISPTSADSRFV
jgi:hypothetical protein